MEQSTSWSRSAGRSSIIPGSLLVTNAGLLLIGAWAALGLVPVSQPPHEGMGSEAHPLALEEYAEPCDEGDVTACNNLGVSYERGYGTERDPGVAMALFDHACRAGSGDACNNQGALLERGWVAGEDIGPVHERYERACTRGSALGCSNLGALYANGTGLARNPARARWLFERACRAGSFIGCENLLALGDARGQAR